MEKEIYEIENLEANLVYQTIQIILGEEFLDNWVQDKDGIIDTNNC